MSLQMQDNYFERIREIFSKIFNCQPTEVEDILKEKNMSIEELNNQILVGIENGYSSELQFAIIEKLIKNS